MGYCFLDSFKTACNILVKFLFSLFFKDFIKFIWCSHTVVLTLLHFGRITILFHQRDQIFIWLIPVNSIPCFTYVYVDTAFSRWDIATEVYELIILLQYWHLMKRLCYLDKNSIGVYISCSLSKRVFTVKTNWIFTINPITSYSICDCLHKTIEF